METDAQVLSLILEAASSWCLLTVIPAVPVAVVSVWLAGRLFNRAWGMSEQEAFLPCMVVQVVFLWGCFSLLWALSLLQQDAEAGARFLSPAKVAEQDSLPIEVGELAWKDLQSCRDGSVKTTESLILLLTEECLQGAPRLRRLHPHRRDIPMPEQSGMPEVFRQLEGYLADPNVKVEDRHHFYRKLTALCYATRMRCAQRVCRGCAAWRSAVWRVCLWVALGVMVVSSVAAYRAIRLIPPAVVF